MTPGDSENLHDLPLLITVKCKKRDDTGDVTNEIRDYAKRPTASSSASTSSGNKRCPLETFVMLELRLPYPPSVNHYWRRVGHRTLISRSGS